MSRATAGSLILVTLLVTGCNKPAPAKTDDTGATPGAEGGAPPPEEKRWDGSTARKPWTGAPTGRAWDGKKGPQ